MLSTISEIKKEHVGGGGHVKRCPWAKKVGTQIALVVNCFKYQMEMENSSIMKTILYFHDHVLRAGLQLYAVMKLFILN